MKILWLSHLVPYPPKGGVLQRAHHLLCELARHHEVDLLAFNQAELMRTQFSSVQEGLAQASKFLGNVCRRHRFLPIPVDQRWKGKQLLALKSLIGAPYTIRWIQSDQYRSAVREWASAGYDFVHFDTISLVPYMRDIPEGTPAALDHHNIESSMLLRRADNENSWIRKAYFRQEGLRLRGFERQYCPRFKVNITCSDLDSSDLREIAPGSHVATVPNGVDTGYFAPRAEEAGAHRLIFVGRLNWYPNAQAATFIAERLWPVLKRAWPGLQMDLVGANPPAAALALSRRDNSFKVHGFVDDVRPLISRATAYICPITDGGGTKLKVLDALAMGKPLVAHPIACEGIAVEEGKSVLFAREPDEYVGHLADLFADPARRQMMSINARRLATERYSFTSIGAELAKLYEGLKEVATPQSFRRALREN